MRVTRWCSAAPGISVDSVRYSVPHQLAGTTVWARFHGDELIVTAVTEHGAVEAARHQRSTPGNPSIKDEHYPPREDKDAGRTPKATSAEEAAFLQLGPGAASWLVEAAAAGARRMRPKTAEAVQLAKLHGTAEVDRALGTAAIAGRFAENDLISILDHHSGRTVAEPTRASEDHRLQPGTSAWSGFGVAPEGDEH
ncbi:Mu transposase domain-containing protein [Streptomyces hygroscopicus]|uniref:Mu transposase domain-containing protein n=1 Tax=Streptomyces hygroscopicus TaxID=1912 RepID=UPI003635926C